MDIARLVDILLRLMMFAIVGRAILSFIVPMVGDKPPPILLNINAMLGQITEPFLSPIRRVLPTVGMLDLSPMVALVIIWVIREVILRNL